MERKTKFSYSRSLKLGPAIGDWTVLQYKDPALEDIQVSQIQNVNFDSLTKETLKTLHYIHYRLAEEMAVRLSKDTDLKVELHTVVASQMTYEDFISGQHDKVVQADYLIQNYGRINVIFGWSLADMIVNRLTGGLGEESEAEYFSSAEAVVLRALMDELVQPFTETWSGAFTGPDVSTSFSTGQFVSDQKISLREAYVTFTVYLYFGKGDLKHVTWAYPSSTIRKLLREKLKRDSGFSPTIHLSSDTLRKSTVDVVATLGKTKLTMKELKTLQPGDVIPLDSSFNHFIDVKLGSDLILKGQPGQRRDKLCLQVYFDQDTAALQPLVLRDDGAQASLATSNEVSGRVEQENRPFQNVTPMAFKAADEPFAFQQEPMGLEEDFVPELGEDSHDDLGAALHGMDDQEDDMASFEEEEGDITSAFPEAAQSMSGSNEAQNDDNVDFDDEDFDWDDFEDDEDL